MMKTFIVTFAYYQLFFMLDADEKIIYTDLLQPHYACHTTLFDVYEREK